MRTSSLHTLLCERVARDFRMRWEKQHPRPPVAGIVFALLMWGLLRLFDLTGLAWVFLFVGGILIVFAVWNEVVRIMGRGVDIQEAILRGHFSPECASHVTMRLRWWNHLIVPQNWARHSRIHERKRQLEAKVNALKKELNELEGEAFDSDLELTVLSKQEIFNLAGKIINLAERMEHQVRIAKITERKSQLIEELRFYSALLHKVEEVTDVLERIDRLEVHVAGNQQTDLTRLVEEACAILEERRRLVIQVDKISPDEFLELVKV